MPATALIGSMLDSGDGSVLVEGRGAGDLLAGFLAVAFTAAALRGAAASPVAAVLCAIVAAGVIGVWTVWRIRPRAELRITPAVITYGRGGSVSTRWENRPGLRLVARRNRNGQWLSVAGDDSTVLHLLGFDLVEVVTACRANGWLFR